MKRMIFIIGIANLAFDVIVLTSRVQLNASAGEVVWLAGATGVLLGTLFDPWWLK